MYLILLYWPSRIIKKKKRDDSNEQVTEYTLFCPGLHRYKNRINIGLENYSLTPLYIKIILPNGNVFSECVISLLLLER